MRKFYHGYLKVVQTTSFKNYFYLLTSNVFGRIIQFLKGIIIAKYIDPGLYGLYRSGELITMLNKFGNLGFNATASREIGTAIGVKDEKRANLYRLSCYSGEFSLAIILLILGITGSLISISDKVLFWVIISATLTLFLSKIHGIYNTEAVIRRNFKVISTSSVVGSLIGSVLTIILVPSYGIYAVMSFPILQELIILFFFLRDFKLKEYFSFFDRRIIPTLKTSFHFSLATLSYGGFKYTERILLLSQLGVQSLGYFSFAGMFAEQVSQLVFMMVKVRKQKLFEDISQGNFLGVHRAVKNETRAFLVLTVISIPIIGLSLHFLVPKYLPNWTEAIEPSFLMLLMVPLKVLGSYESIVIVSPIVDKQTMLTKGMIISTVFMIILSTVIGFYIGMKLKYFIIINLVSYSLYIIAIKYTYYKYFYLNLVERGK